jgi:ribosomal protein L29
MDTKTLRAKTSEALQNELKEAREHLSALGFKIAASQLKNVREVRKTKIKIARLLTLIREKNS